MRTLLSVFVAVPLAGCAAGMGPIRYSLCQWAVVGPALWAANLCAFPPLVAGHPLPLHTAAESGTVTSVTGKHTASIECFAGFGPEDESGAKPIHWWARCQ